MDSKIERNNSELTLKDLIMNFKVWSVYLFSKWYFLIFFIGIGFGLGLLYCYLKKPLYTARTSFVLELGDNVGGGMAQYAGIASMMGIDLGGNSGGIFQGDNLLELYKSHEMIVKSLMKSTNKDSSLTLLESYVQINGDQDRWKKKSPDLLKINFKLDEQNNSILQRSRDSILKGVVDEIRKNNLTIFKPNKKLSIIEVKVVSPNEQFSKEFNESLVKEVNDFYIKTKTKKSLDNIEILQSKTDSVRAVMNGAIETTAHVIDNTPNLNPTRQAQRMVPSQRSQFSAETNKAILTQLVQHLEMAKMSFMKESPLIQVIDFPIYPLHVEKVSLFKAIVLGVGFSLMFGVFLLIFFKIIYSK